MLLCWCVATLRRIKAKLEELSMSKEEEFVTKANRVAGSHGWNYTKLAEALGIGKQYMSALVNEKKSPSGKIIARMEQIFLETLHSSSSELAKGEQNTNNEHTIELSPAAYKAAIEGMKISGLGGDLTGFVVDCIYRRLTQLEQRKTVKETIAEMRQSGNWDLNNYVKDQSPSTRKKTGKNKLNVDENN